MIYIGILVKMKTICLNKCNVKITLFDSRKTIIQFNKLAQIQIASNLNFNPTIDHKCMSQNLKLKATTNNENKGHNKYQRNTRKKRSYGEEGRYKKVICRFVGRHERHKYFYYIYVLKI